MNVLSEISSADELIEYCPEEDNTEDQSCDDFLDNSLRIHHGTVHKARNVVTAATASETVDVVCIYVCSLCFRQYGLKEDLRGHMIEYHKYEPIGPQTQKESRKALREFKKSRGSNELLSVEKSEEILNTPTEVPFATTEPELRPVPFKDFRIILRSKLTLRCAVNITCAYKFESATQQELHAKCHKDNGAQEFKCSECGLECASWRRCSAHLWKAHHVDVDLLHCPECTFKSHASVLVWRHMRVHKKWRARVLRSMRVVQQRRQEQSPKKVSDAKPTVAPNKNKYYAEKTCEICSRKFVNGKTLSKHVKTVHNKIKPFICNVCGRKTARKASLIIHMRQHTGEKPLQCKTCKFTTRDPSVLHKHQLRHEKAGKLKCALCDYACIQTNAYKRHMRLNHPAAYNKIACDLCTYVTISEQKLLAHKEDHRKGLIVNWEDSMDATRAGGKRKLHDKNNEISADCFMPLESVDSLPHEPAVDTGGVTIPAPSEDTQFPTYLNN